MAVFDHFSQFSPQAQWCRLARVNPDKLRAGLASRRTPIACKMTVGTPERVLWCQGRYSKSWGHIFRPIIGSGASYRLVLMSPDVLRVDLVASRAL